MSGDTRFTTGVPDAGIGLGTLFTLLFVGLRLAHIIEWSWWWVTSPMWISIGLWLLVILAAIIFVFVSERHK